MIIRRYFTIELIRVLLAVVGILLLIALSNRFVVLIGRAAYGNLSLSMVLNVLWYHIPDLLAFLLPLSLFLAILLVLGRWYTDRELTALQACGMPWRTILTPIFTTATLIALIVGSFTLFVVPKLQIEKEKLLRKEESVLLLETLSAEHFHALQSGRVVVYVEKISSDKDHMQHLFIAEKSPDTRSWSVLIANEATLKTESGLYTISLKDGSRYEGEPGQLGYNRLSFSDYTRQIHQSDRAVPSFHRVTPTEVLWHETALGAKAELAWRFAVPVTTWVLAFLAVPLARTNPRSGRYARIFSGILLYIFYYNALTVSRRWIESGILPLWIGQWWVHCLFLCIAFFLWYFPQLSIRKLLRLSS